jgi:LysR family cys regulon transcriptional activator
MRRTAYLRGYIYDFIHLFAPHLDRAAVDAARGRIPDAAAV